MDPLYFSRATLRRGPGSTGTLAALLLQGPDEAGSAHRLVWTLFGDDADRERDFLYHRSDAATGAPGDGPSFYMLSRRPPEDRHALWRLETKDYAPALRSGDRVGFALRANPVVRRAEPPGKRHDVVMDRKQRALPGDDDLPPAEIERRAAAEWLAARGPAGGFAVAAEEVAAGAYRQHRIPRGGGRPIRFSSIDLTGRLTVAEPDRLLSTIARGLGSAKAFGCGLLLIRRA